MDCAGQIGLALERVELAKEAEAARVTVEKEGLRSTLLASISHDLRRPLAVIAGASSALNDPTIQFDAEARRMLSASIEAKAQEMSDIISNVLELMRLESGEIARRREWQSIEEILETALARLSARLSKQTPAGSRLSVSARFNAPFVHVSADDEGPGFPSGDPEHLFAKFHRGRDESNTGGAGLGLTICCAIINAHGGSIVASASALGDAQLAFTIPAPDAS